MRAAPGDWTVSWPSSLLTAHRGDTVLLRDIRLIGRVDALNAAGRKTQADRPSMQRRWAESNEAGALLLIISSVSTQTRLGHGWGCSSSRCKCRYMRRWAIGLYKHRPTALGSDDDTVRLYACLPTRLVTRSELSWTFGICRVRSQGFPHSECLHQTQWAMMRRSTSQ